MTDQDKIRKVIIDTDPGQDDAFAILLALASPKLDVTALTTVSGNVPVAQTTDNACRILEHAGHGHIPVYQGSAKPLMREPRAVPEIHGSTGIDGWDWAPARKKPEVHDAVTYLTDTLSGLVDEPLTVIALAPQTNIATALQKAPEIARNIKEIIFMGGGYFEGGNMTPAAEYNILVDPEAARIVLNSGIPVHAISLDCTHSAPAPVGWSNELESLNTLTGRICAGMMRFFEVYGNRKHGTKSRPLHDAVAVGYCLWPELFEGKACPVDIEVSGELTTGMTVVDWLRQTGKPDNCVWARRCTEATELYDRMLATLSRLP